MVLEKQRLNCNSIEAQTALELPDRETLSLITINVEIGDVLSGNRLNVTVQDINTATQVCALVDGINALSLAPQALWCSIHQW
jgi:hypothetical protein